MQRKIVKPSQLRRRGMTPQAFSAVIQSRGGKVREVFRYVADKEVYIWDIGMALGSVKQRATDLILDVDNLSEQLKNAEVDPNWAMSEDVDMTFPLLLVQSPEAPGKLLLMDGRHRLYKAHDLQVGQVHAWLLSKEEEFECRLQGGGVKNF